MRVLCGSTALLLASLAEVAAVDNTPRQIVDAVGPICTEGGVGSSQCFHKYCRGNAGLCTDKYCFGVCKDRNSLRWAAGGLYNDGDACSSSESENSCKLCPKGRYTPNTVVHGYTECSACAPGQYQDAMGQSSCKPCASSRDPGAVFCTNDDTNTDDGTAVTAAPAATTPTSVAKCVESPWSGWSPCVLNCGKHADKKECTCSVFRSRINLNDARRKPCPPLMEEAHCSGDAHHGCFDLAHAQRREADSEAPEGECAAPPDVHFATYRSTGYHEGAEARYTCFAGYRLSGLPQSNCKCDAGQKNCKWTAPPVCQLEIESEVGSTSHWSQGNFRGTCDCNPSRDVATDVTCKLDRDLSHIRVLHIKGAKEHRHHKCAYLGKSEGGCKCCDCTRSVIATNGCPCGAAEVFFEREWQMDNTKYWWSFKPVLGTQTCEVRGELLRNGRALGLPDGKGDVFALGRVGVSDDRLAFEGVWTEPSDSHCKAAWHYSNLGTPTSAAVWARLQDWKKDGTHCGFMHFFIADGKLDGTWRYKSWPKQESWDVDWKAPVKGALCSASRGASSKLPLCSTLHKNSLFGAPSGPRCSFLPDWYTHQEQGWHHRLR